VRQSRWLSSTTALTVAGLAGGHPHLDAAGQPDAPAFPCTLMTTNRQRRVGSQPFLNGLSQISAASGINKLAVIARGDVRSGFLLESRALHKEIADPGQPSASCRLHPPVASPP